jgi:PTS system galactitol-specific IIC component
MCHPLIAGLFYAFWSQNIFVISAVVVLYFVLYFLFRKYRVQVVEFLERTNQDTQKLPA